MSLFIASSTVPFPHPSNHVLFCLRQLLTLYGLCLVLGHPRVALCARTEFHVWATFYQFTLCQHCRLPLWSSLFRGKVNRRGGASPMSMQKEHKSHQSLICFAIIFGNLNLMTSFCWTHLVKIHGLLTLLSVKNNIFFTPDHLLQFHWKYKLTHFCTFTPGYEIIPDSDSKLFNLEGINRKLDSIFVTQPGQFSKDEFLVSVIWSDCSHSRWYR